MHLALQNQTLAAELLLKCILSFTGSLRTHFYTDSFLDEETLTK